MVVPNSSILYGNRFYNYDVIPFSELREKLKKLRTESVDKDLIVSVEDQ